MADKQRTPVGLVAVGAILILVLTFGMRLLDPPWWGWVVGLGVLAIAAGVFARVAAHAPRHERFAAEEQWSTPVPAGEALERIGQHFSAEGATVTRNACGLVVEMGSDVRFRFSGIESHRGRRAFPSTLTVTATETSAGAGSHLRVRSRDNLGWYLTMHPGIPQWAAERNAHLITTCRQLTRGEEGNPPPLPPGAPAPEEARGPVNLTSVLNASYLVSAWVAWAGLTVLFLATGDSDLLSGLYLGLTAGVVLLTVGQVLYARKKQREWAQRHQDL